MSRTQEQAEALIHLLELSQSALLHKIESLQKVSRSRLERLKRERARRGELEARVHELQQMLRANTITVSKLDPTDDIEQGAGL